MQGVAGVVQCMFALLLRLSQEDGFDFGLNLLLGVTRKKAAVQDASGDEAESSNSDFVPEIAPAEISQESDDIVTQPARKRKMLQRKKRKSKRPADTSELRDEGSDKSEAEEIEPSLWSTSEPSNIVRSPKIWDPQFSSKVPTHAAEAFALYFTDDLLGVIIGHTNREGARKYGRN
ncbi:hypothetical protein HPB49_026425 [Dermacentor silvarum]|nr:hypothetical protein HPB49_026425 [Dermacentor silvarum]